MCLRIVSAYKPHANEDPYTVYQQHLQHYEQNNNKNNPIINFNNEMSMLITNWMDIGNQVLIMIDANENFSKNTPGTF